MKTVVSQETLAENMKRIHDFLRNSCQQAKDQVNGGVTFLKDELTGITSRAGQYVNRMLLPVNNYLKDISQIDQELQGELNKEPEHFVLLQGHVIPLQEVLTRDMEENY